MRKRRWAIAAVTSISMGASASAFASEVVYPPLSATLGGNPLNGTFLLSTAQGQGEGTKSGNQGPDLSGLDAALSNLDNGSGGTPSGSTPGGSPATASPQSNGPLQTTATFRALRTAAPLTTTATAGGSL